MENAKFNAEKNEIANANFHCGSVDDIVYQLYNNGEKADIVVIDPPRAGTNEKTLNTIIKMNPKKVIYVSCNPATLARDIKHLTENSSYRIKKSTPIDMFPHTTHVETVVLLSNQRAVT